MSQNLKYLAVAAGNLFAEGLERGTVMSISRQHGSVVEVPCKTGVPFLLMELEIWSDLMVSLMLRNTGRYLSTMQYHEGGI